MRKRARYQKTSAKILKDAEITINKLLTIKYSKQQLIRKFDLLDLWVRWLLHCAMCKIFGSKNQPPTYVRPEGFSPAGGRTCNVVKAKGKDYSQMSECWINEEFGGDRPNIGHLTEINTSGASIQMEVLHNHWKNEMTGTKLNTDDLPEFPEGEEYLRGLWETPAPLPESRRGKCGTHWVMMA